MEVTGVSYLPWNDKNVFQRFMLPYLFYILVVPTIGLYDFAMRFTVHAVKGQKLRPENFLPLFELAMIHIIQNNFGNGQGDGFYSSTTLWLTMHVTCSAWIITIGTTAAHHHPGLAAIACFLSFITWIVNSKLIHQIKFSVKLARDHSYTCIFADIYRAGDDPRGQDWGIYQLDATRYIILRSLGPGPKGDTCAKCTLELHLGETP